MHSRAAALSTEGSKSTFLPDNPISSFTASGIGDVSGDYLGVSKGLLSTGRSKVLSASAVAERTEVFFNLRRKFPKLLAIVRRNGLCSGKRRNRSLASRVCPLCRSDSGSHLVAISKAVIGELLKPPVISRMVAFCTLSSLERVVSLASDSTGLAYSSIGRTKVT